MEKKENNVKQETKLVILRGNSASGKSTTALKIRDSFPRGEVMLISQDDIRLGILNVKDRVYNLTADLIKTIALFGKSRFKIILIEGILGTHIYKNMFSDLVASFKHNSYIYYFDIPFEETVRRHNTRDKSSLWGEEKMKHWWLEKDYLRLGNEKTINSDLTEKDILKMILDDIR